MSRLRKAILAAWCVVGALLIAIPLTIAGGWPFAVGVLCVIVSVICVGGLIVTWGDAEAAQEQAFLDTYGSLDGARAVLDLDTLRTVRDTRGVARAILTVRREHPKIPLAQAAAIIHGL